MVLRQLQIPRLTRVARLIILITPGTITAKSITGSIIIPLTALHSDKIRMRLLVR
jgi:hypothetical protein